LAAIPDVRLPLAFPAVLFEEQPGVDGDSLPMPPRIGEFTHLKM
jgi:hypothetical protein